MSDHDLLIACAACGRVRSLHAKGLCHGCYEKDHSRRGACIDCGVIRPISRKGRCVRCYRLSRTSVRLCPLCHKQRPVWGKMCESCKAKRRLGAAQSCPECLAWSLTVRGGRCRACRNFAAYNHPGDCRSCGRHLPTNASRRCRLCAVTRRQAHLAGQPGWSIEPGAISGIQLFFGELHGACLRHPRAACNTEKSAPGAAVSGMGRGGLTVTDEQLTLFLLAPMLDLLSPERVSATVAQAPAVLMEAVVAFGEGRGWPIKAIRAVQRAVAVTTGAGATNLVKQNVVHQLSRLGLPGRRSWEFLVAQGLVAASGEEQCNAWFEEHLGGLPGQVACEVGTWVEALRGIGRSRPRRPVTIQHYLRAAEPALREWSRCYGSLRQVDSEDVSVYLETLVGHRRTLAAVALRSLFSTLKARRLIFADPTKATHPGSFNQTPVLGLTPGTRRSVLTSTERADHRLVILLAGVHALSRADMAGLCLEDVDCDAGTIVVNRRRRHLDTVTKEQLMTWLMLRRQRWPNTANPHVLVSAKSALGLGAVSEGYFRCAFAGLPTTAGALRADRLLAEATDTGGDPMRLTGLFGVHPRTAMRYCAELDLGAEPGGDGSG